MTLAKTFRRTLLLTLLVALVVLQAGRLVTPAGAAGPEPIEEYGAVSVYSFDLMDPGWPAADTIEGPVAVVGSYLYTPMGVALLPCSGWPVWAAASSDGSRVYVVSSDGFTYSLCMAYWRSGGGPAFSSGELPGPLHPGHALVYAGVLYAWLEKGGHAVYIVADAATGTVRTWRLKGSWALGPEGSPVEVPGDVQGGLEIIARNPAGRSIIYRHEGGLAIRWLSSWKTSPVKTEWAAAGEGLAVYAVPVGVSITMAVLTQVPYGGPSVRIYGYTRILDLNEYVLLAMTPKGRLVAFKYSASPTTFSGGSVGLVDEFNPTVDTACLLGRYVALTHKGYLHVYRVDDGGALGEAKVWVGLRPWADCTRDGTGMVVIDRNSERVFIVARPSTREPSYMLPLALGGGSVYYASDSGLVKTVPATLPGAPVLPGYIAAVAVMAEHNSTPSIGAGNYTVAPTDFDSIGVYPDPGVGEFYVITPRGIPLGPFEGVGAGVYKLNGLVWDPWDFEVLAVEPGDPPFPFEALGAVTVPPPPSVLRAVVLVESSHARITAAGPGRLDVLVVMRGDPLPFASTVYYTCGGGELVPVTVPANVTVYAAPFNPGISGCPSLRVVVPGYWEGGVPRMVARASIDLEGGVLVSSGAPITAELYAQRGPSGILAAGTGVVRVELNASNATVLVVRGAVLRAVSGTLEFNVSVPLLNVTVTAASATAAVNATTTEPAELVHGVPGWLYTVVAAAGGVGLACTGSRLYYSRRR